MTHSITTRERVALKVRLTALFSAARNGTVDVTLKSWKGATIGMLLGMIVYLILIASFIDIGVGWYADVLISLVLMALVILGVGSINRFLFNIVKRWDSRFVAVVLMAAIALSFLPMSIIGKSIVVDLFVSGGLIGFAVARGPKRPISIVVMILTLACNAYWITALQDAGFDATVPVTEEYWNQEPPPMHVDDPSCPGPFKVRALTYGSGTDQRRPEYGSNVTMKTTSVDATPFFDQSRGFFNFVREVYWGFNSKNYPLNARVWYPDTTGPFPLVLIVHGNHLMSHFSDAGYDYLGKLLASRGFILASVDENFLNLSWIQDYEQSEVFARGWLLLKHLEQWRSWNGSEGNPFSKKVDMNNIALIGHSGGVLQWLWQPQSIG
jgi:hypothetical protein